MLDISISCFKTVYFETAIRNHDFNYIIGFVLLNTLFKDSTNEILFRIIFNLSTGQPQKILRKYSHFSKQIYHLIIEYNINHISKINLKDRTDEIYEMFYNKRPYDSFIKYFPKHIKEKLNIKEYL